MLMSVPEAIHSEAAQCRRSWKVCSGSGSPCLRSFWNNRDTCCGSNGRRSSIVKTCPSPIHASWAASRSSHWRSWQVSRAATAASFSGSVRRPDRVFGTGRFLDPTVHGESVVSHDDCAIGQVRIRPVQAGDLATPQTRPHSESNNAPSRWRPQRSRNCGDGRVVEGWPARLVGQRPSGVFGRVRGKTAAGGGSELLIFVQRRASDHATNHACSRD
jgi:hypothetical protein